MFAALQTRRDKHQRILNTLALLHHDVSLTAKCCDCSRQTVYNIINEHNVQLPPDTTVLINLVHRVWTNIPQDTINAPIDNFHNTLQMLYIRVGHQVHF
jgi:hypothetical protein